MINILIADDNAYYASNLLNYINDKNKNVRICGIVRNGKEAIEKINSNNDIDIILLDFKMPLYNGEEVLKKVRDKNKLENSFIIITGEIELIKELQKNNMVYGIFDKLVGFEKIYTSINELIKYKETTKYNEKIKSRVTEELLFLGYNISHKGTQYLIRTIQYIVTHPNNEVEKLEKYIYPKIAKMYKDSTHNVKCSIIRATNSMYYECEIERLKKYFYFADDFKPTAKVVKNTIANKLS